MGFQNARFLKRKFFYKNEIHQGGDFSLSFLKCRSRKLKSAKWNHSHIYTIMHNSLQSGISLAEKIDQGSLNLLSGSTRLPARSSTYNCSTILSPAGRSTSKPSTHFVMSQSINSDVNILSGADEQKSFKAGNDLFHFLLLSRYKCSKIWTICGQN